MHELDEITPYSCHMLRSELLAGKNRPPTLKKRVDLIPSVHAALPKTQRKKKGTLRVLLDSGASSSLVARGIVHTHRLKAKREHTSFNTAAGTFNTVAYTTLDLLLPEFSESRKITWGFHVHPGKLGSYDMIIGRDLLLTLGIRIDFDTASMTWNDVSVPMKSTKEVRADSYHVQDTGKTKESMERVKRILDAKYEPADLPEIVGEMDHLDTTQKGNLLDLLQKYESLFDGTLGKWTGTEYHIELKPGAEPYHSRAFPVPRVHEPTLRLEVNRLVKEGVLRKVNHSEWGAPTFIIPKKDGTVRFISDFRELNKRIKRKPYPIPKIQDMLLKLEGFQYATSLDLNMGYYHIELTPFSKRLCTIVLPWGKYEYQRLPMGLCNSPDIFQEKMGELMTGLEFVRTYIDDVLCLTTGSWQDHLAQLDEVLKRVQQAGLKVNARKSFFGRDSLEYLGYWITRDGIQPLPKKVDAIKNIATPQNAKQLRSFIGMVNYYRDMWIRRSDVLAPLSKLTAKQTKWKWTHVEQQAFDLTKKILSRETLLAYPNFDLPFDLYTDASHTQLGAVISQNDRPIAFYSRKLNPAQTRYTTTERELLAIVETLKEFRNILLGQRIRVFTDHKNLTYKTFNTERVMRWRLIIEEFGPELHHIKGEKNVVADALSRLDLQNEMSIDNNPPEEQEELLLNNALDFGLKPTELPKSAFPLRFKTIAYYQARDEALAKITTIDSAYRLRSFHGGGTEIKLWCRNDKIVVPPPLQRRVVEWYHENLVHPGENRTEATIRQHFTWKNLRKDVEDVCKKCYVCQITKKTKKKYGLLPPKDAEAIPWNTLCVDTIGPYKIQQKKRKEPLILHAVTMIDPATGWFEVREINESCTAYEVASIVEQTWLTRYPWPTEVIMDRGTEFLKEFRTMLQKDYDCIRKVISTRNPQANSMVERVHQTLGNLLRTFRVHKRDEADPWGNVLAACMFAIRSTVHTTLQATPAQLVFGRDSLLNIKFEADWEAIKQRKQKLIDENNRRENDKRKNYQYQVGEKILIQKAPKGKYGDDPYEGPYEITQVNSNGTVRYRNGVVTDVINIRQIHPFQE